MSDKSFTYNTEELPKDFSQIVKKYPHITREKISNENMKNFEHSIMKENSYKNRYTDVLCLENTRYIFSKAEFISGELSLFVDTPIVNYSNDVTRYINANHVNDSMSKISFIATQAPYEKTMSDFFEMIWQTGCFCIITLGNVSEGNNVKMTQYWPSSTEKIYKVNFTITLIEELTYPDHICIRKMKLFNSNSFEEREIFQIHYTGWPDYGVPENVNALNAIYNHQKKILHGKKQCPTIVHCSAGIGRTGTYISYVHAVEKCEALMQQKESPCGKIDIKSIVENVRYQRNGAVQTLDQYLYIHKSVQEFIKTNFQFSN
jgi:protein tyrosine phosphatase